MRRDMAIWYSTIKGSRVSYFYHTYINLKFERFQIMSHGEHMKKAVYLFNH